MVWQFAREITFSEEIADEVLEKALETIKKENVVRSILQNGGTLQQAYAENGAI